MVRPVLDALPNIESWDVNTELSDKVLEVRSVIDPCAELQQELSELGFEIEQLK